MFSVMHELEKALVPDGILYASFKHGDHEGIRSGRYFTDFTVEGFQEFIKELPELQVEEHWVTGDVRSGREEEKWLNIILRKTGIN